MKAVTRPGLIHKADPAKKYRPTGRLDSYRSKGRADQVTAAVKARFLIYSRFTSLLHCMSAAYLQRQQAPYESRPWSSKFIWLPAKQCCQVTSHNQQAVQ